MTEKLVEVEIAGGVAWVTMNRPKALNALNRDMTQALIGSINPLEHDPGVRCVVIRGGDHFMAGGDLKSFHAMLGRPRGENLVALEAFVHEVHSLIIAIRRMPKPVVASVRGACAGFGLSFMSAADLAIAADDSYYTLAYTLIGTSPDGGSTYALPRLVGLKKAAELALLGDRFDAAAAKDYGLVNWVVPAADLTARRRSWRPAWRPARPSPTGAPRRCCSARWTIRWSGSCSSKPRISRPAPSSRISPKASPPSWKSAGRPLPARPDLFGRI